VFVQISQTDHFNDALNVNYVKAKDALFYAYYFRLSNFLTDVDYLTIFINSL